MNTKINNKARYTRHSIEFKTEALKLAKQDKWPYGSVLIMEVRYFIATEEASIVQDCIEPCLTGMVLRPA